MPGPLPVRWWEGGIAWEDRRSAAEHPDNGEFPLPLVAKSFIDDSEWDLLTHSSLGER